jgi:hypothetical protein
MFGKNLIWLCLAICFTTACHSSKGEPASTGAAASVPATANEPTYSPGPAPTEAEVRKALTRNYEDALAIEHTRGKFFLVGDFNGDNSEDIAIVVKAARAQLAKVNSEYSNWILEDPRQVTRAREQRSRPATVTASSNDVLLAVIHGFEREGWRHTLARETYLLKNAVGEEVETQQGGHRGDVIREKLDGTPGIIYWTGGKYAWHPVPTDEH